MIKKTNKISILKNVKWLYLLSAVLFLITAGCGHDPYFMRVVYIDDVPVSGTAGTPLILTATVRPVFATNSTIVWRVDDAGTTGAVLAGNVLYTTAKGIVSISARIKNGIAEGMDYTQDFFIDILDPIIEDPNMGGITVIITFADISDETPIISPSALILSRTAKDGKPKKIIISLAGGYNNVKWEITGTGFSESYISGIVGTGNSFTLNATDSRYNQLGDHLLTLIVYNGGVPYNKVIIFTIVE